MIDKTTWKVVTTAGIALIAGWCIYFDQQRRKDPDYKKNVKDRRKRASRKGSSAMEKEVLQNFFVKEIQMGELCIQNGDIGESIDHFVNAIIVCGQPDQLLLVLQKTLPVPVFDLVVLKVREFSEMDAPNVPNKFVTLN